VRGERIPFSVDKSTEIVTTTAEESRMREIVHKSGGGDGGKGPGWGGRFVLWGPPFKKRVLTIYEHSRGQSARKTVLGRSAKKEGEGLSEKFFPTPLVLGTWGK